MKIKHLFSTWLGLVLSTSTLSAQSEPFKLIDNISEEGHNWMIKINPHQFLSIIRKNGEPTCTLRNLNDEGVELAKNTYTFPSEPKVKYFFNRTISVTDQSVRILCVKKDEAANNNALLFMDLDTGLKKITLLPVFETYALNKNETDGLTLSPNGKILVHAFYKRPSPSDPFECKAVLFDTATGKKMGEKTFTSSQKSKQFYLLTLQVDDEGQIFLSSNVKKDSDEREDNFSKYLHQIHRIDPSNAVQHMDVDFEGKNINRWHSFIDKDSINFFMFMNNVDTPMFKRRMKLVNDGFAMNSIDWKNFKVNRQIVVDMPALYPNLETEDCIPYYFKWIYKRPKGGFVVIAEQYKKVVIPRTHKNPKNSGGSTIYINESFEQVDEYYCDMAVIYISAKFRVESVKRIAKLQLNVQNMSFIHSYNPENDVVQLLYEDKLKNIDKYEDRDVIDNANGMFYSRSKNGLFLAQVKPKGFPNKFVVIDYESTPYRPDIVNSIWLTPNKLVIKSEETQLGFIDLGSFGQPIQRRQPRDAKAPKTASPAEVKPN